MSASRLARSTAAVLTHDALPPIWLCPSLLPSTRRYFRTSSTALGNTGKTKSEQRREKVREGEKVRRNHALLEQGVLPKDSSGVRQIVNTRISQDLAEYRERIAAGQLLEAFELLRTSIGPRDLTPIDSHALTQLTFHHVRTRASPKAKLEETLELLQRWYKERDLAAAPRVTLSILLSFRELGRYEDAANFWDWARRQPSASRSESVSARELRKVKSDSLSADYTDLMTYGVVLDILARAGRTFEETESVYIEGVRRYAVGFNEYHLKPDAWMLEPDKFTKIPGASSSMLAGQMSSRFVHGKIVAGYLGLDTLLRLYPTQIPRPALLQAIQERPVSEQFQITCMYLRGGNAAPASLITSTLLNLSMWAERASFDNRKQILESMFVLARLAYASETELNVSHLNIMLRSVMARHVNRTDGATTLPDVKLAVCILQLFQGLGVSADDSTLRQIDAISVKEESSALLALRTILLHDPVNEIAIAIWMEHLLPAYAELGMFKSIKTWMYDSADRSDPALWSILVSSLGKYVTHAKSDNDAENAASVASDFLKTQLDRATLQEHILGSKAEEIRASFELELRTVLEPETNNYRELPVAGARESSEDEPIPAVAIPGENPGKDNGSPLLDSAAPSEAGSNLWSVVNRLNDLAQEELLHDLEKTPLSGISILSHPSVPDEWQQELYRELVLGKFPDDESAPVSRQAQEKDGHSQIESKLETFDPDYEYASTLTCLSLAQVRYQNWCDMNHVLLQAQAFETLLDEGVGKAMAAGEAFSRVRTTWRVKEKERASVLQSQWEMYEKVREAVLPVFESKDVWQRTIRELRKGIDTPVDV